MVDSTTVHRRRNMATPSRFAPRGSLTVSEGRARGFSETYLVKLRCAIRGEVWPSPFSPAPGPVLDGHDQVRARHIAERAKQLVQEGA